MLDTARARRRAVPASSRASPGERPELIDWLRTGRLRLVDERRRAITEEGWATLSPQARARTLGDFERIVRGGAKAAVIVVHDRIAA